MVTVVGAAFIAVGCEEKAALVPGRRRKKVHMRSGRKWQQWVILVV
jgi:hypothetical protein